MKNELLRYSKMVSKIAGQFMARSSYGIWSREDIEQELYLKIHTSFLKDPDLRTHEDRNNILYRILVNRSIDILNMCKRRPDLDVRLQNELDLLPKDIPDRERRKIEYKIHCEENNFRGFHGERWEHIQMYVDSLLSELNDQLKARAIREYVFPDQHIKETLGVSLNKSLSLKDICKHYDIKYSDTNKVFEKDIKPKLLNYLR